MSKYRGLFTFDVDNHRYLPIEQADGLISDMNYSPEPKEEPEGWWFIDIDYEPHATNSTLRNLEADREIGNYFETEEQAEKAVEKLKAWKRLKDKGFKFVGWEDTNNDVNDILFELPYMEWDKNVSDDLDSLFGGEK